MISGLAPLLLRAFQGGPCGGTPAVLGGGCRIFLSPDGDHVSVEHILDVARVEDVEGDLPGAAAKLDCSGPRALQPAILQPAVPLALLDRQNVLDLPARLSVYCAESVPLISTSGVAPTSPVVGQGSTPPRSPMMISRPNATGSAEPHHSKESGPVDLSTGPFPYWANETSGII